MNIGKIIRAGLGILVVFVLAVVVFNWYNDFRTAPPTSASSAPVGSTGASATTSVAGMYGVAKSDGVNFRVKPASNAKLIRGLKKGEKVTIITKDGQWYNVKDTKGIVGWITANGDYVAVVRK